VIDDNDDNDNKKDITRIEEMPHFEHEENTELPELPNLEEQGDDTTGLPELPEAASESVEEISIIETPGFETTPAPDLPTLDFETQETDFSGGNAFENTLSTNFNSDEITTPPAAPELVITSTQTYTDTTFEEKSIDAPSENVKESFADVKSFAENLTYGNVTKGGNPPFTIMLKKIKFKEDKTDIENILREHGLLNNDNEKLYLQSLEGGSLLLSQISEYSAIYLTHKFRRFDLEIVMGLSDEIHPSKSYDHEFRGLVNKDHIFQNRTESLELNSRLEAHQIILTTQATLPSFQILKYLGLISEHQIVDESAITGPEQDEVTISQGALEEIFQNITQLKKDIKKTLPAEDRTDLAALYKVIAEKLRTQAIKQGANAVVGIIYQLTALPARQGDAIKYKITCTGNAVIVNSSTQKSHGPNP